MSVLQEKEHSARNEPIYTDLCSDCSDKTKAENLDLITWRSEEGVVTNRIGPYIQTTSRMVVLRRVQCGELVG